jgi:hypothetical protein
MLNLIIGKNCEHTAKHSNELILSPNTEDTLSQAGEEHHPIGTQVP